MTSATTISSFDGEELAIHRMGEGQPVVLLHGLFSSAQMNWIKYGHAAKLVASGFECIMPDLRAHGESAKPHDASAYPHDVLVSDAAAVVEKLGLEHYDLVGFSLGARTAARGVLSGLRPRKLVLAGMGLEGLAGWEGRAAFFIDAIDRYDDMERGDPAYFAKNFMKTMKTDRIAARHLLQSVGDTAPDALGAIAMPTAVVCGDDDRDNGSAENLAEAIPDAVHIEVPGTHMSSVVKPELGEAIVRYLTA
ncbi:alpha/beta fold hydrolase [Pseudoblastomonas halimionae]|uniref:Alpha/beta fold hydrolase n=1 Tax=Alteriqipengyuania halimionae TaxID=1926630 RepID=A0A6I4U5L8_9SPHN|nr:alpha/beta fold hydrolase [Alteriqipengyuania halimionae]MXP09741.1 alpha/beta fold hydrolase [Alteriqipengyuania halimionae]